MVIYPLNRNIMFIETTLKIIDVDTGLSVCDRKEIVDFLFKNLGQYGDSQEDIGNAIDHILSPQAPAGGFIVLSYQYLAVSGAVVVNRTGMQGYIPENILVYIAVRRDLQGNGLGRELMQNAIERADGNIALHVEPENPARHLYEKLGFENKYLEMRFIKK